MPDLTILDTHTLSSRFHSNAYLWSERSGWDRRSAPNGWRALNGFATLYLRRLKNGKELPFKATATQRDLGLTDSDAMQLRQVLDRTLREYLEEIVSEVSKVSGDHHPELYSRLVAARSKS